MIEQLTKAAFVEKIWAFEKTPIPEKKDDIPCVVFFYLENPLCHAQNEILKRLSELFSGKIHFFKVNVLKEQLLTADLGIRKVPALVFIFANKSPRIATGVFSEKVLQKALNQLMQ